MRNGGRRVVRIAEEPSRGANPWVLERFDKRKVAAEHFLPQGGHILNSRSFASTANPVVVIVKQVNRDREEECEGERDDPLVERVGEDLRGDPQRPRARSVNPPIV
jgi:hypothetical protein